MEALPNELFNDVDLLIQSRAISNEFRKKGLFCDTTIKTIDGTEFKVHKLILATSCTYFRGLFKKGDATWKETELPVISLDKDISSECFEKVLNYLYTGKVEVNSENAFLLHEGAVYFNLRNLKKIVTKFPIKRIEMNTVLDLWRYGVKFFNFEIEEKCIEFINANCEAFLEKNLKMLDSSEIKKIASIKDIKLSQENLYIYVTDWIKANFPDREHHLRFLLNKIKFNLIKDEMKIRNILSDTILLQSKDFLELMVRNYHESLLVHVDTNNQLEDVLIGVSSKLLYKIDLNGEQRIFKSILKHEKTNSDYIVHTTCNKKYLLFLYVDNTHKCECYDPRTNEIKQFPTLPSVVRKLCGIANLNNRIFVVGGTGFKSTEILDLDAGTWIKGADLTEVRSAFSLTSAENSLYAIGGLKGDNTNHTTIEKFNSIEKKWESLTVPNCNIGLNRAVYYNRKIYCFTSKDGRIYDIAENSFEGLISKQPLEWVNNNFNVAYNGADSFCYVFGLQKVKDINRYAIFKYKFDDSTWEELNIEVPSELENDLKIAVLNVPLTFQKIKLFNWMSSANNNSQ